jgi:hypothetical protein
MTTESNSSGDQYYKRKGVPNQITILDRPETITVENSRMARLDFDKKEYELSKDGSR